MVRACLPDNLRLIAGTPEKVSACRHAAGTGLQISRGSAKPMQSDYFWPIVVVLLGVAAAFYLLDWLPAAFLNILPF